MRLVSGSLPHPLATRVLGDLLVRQISATGDGRLFPDADVLHVPGADHFGLLNHPDVRRALVDWLDEPIGQAPTVTTTRPTACPDTR